MEETRESGRWHVAGRQKKIQVQKPGWHRSRVESSFLKRDMAGTFVRQRESSESVHCQRKQSAGPLQASEVLAAEEVAGTHETLMTFA